MHRRRFITTASSACLAGALLPSCTGRSRQALNVFTWADYLSDDAAATFEEKFDCRLVIDTFDSNEAMIAKLDSGATGYDILVPSSYAVKQLETMDFLQPLDHSLIPNLANMDADYLSHALDPGMKLSAPYMMAPTVMAYLKSRVPNPEPSWNMFLREDIRGRATLLDDMREVLGSALLTLGHSLNSVIPAELEEAVELAIRWKANIAKFENEQFKSGIASGEFFLVQGYAGELIAVQDENEDIELVIPQEGAAYPCDDLCIPRTASNPELAHAFINHLCDAEVAAENMEWIGYRAPNTAAYALLPEEFRNNPILFPPAEIFEKCETIGYLGDDLPLWTAAWERVKSA